MALSDDIVSVFIMIFGIGFFLFVVWIVQRDDEDRWKRKMIEMHEKRMTQIFNKTHGDSQPKK